MVLWKEYLERQASYCCSIDELPEENLHFIVVIPCFNEPDLIRTIESINNCKAPKRNTEIIVVINSPENSEAAIVSRNAQTFNDIRDWKKANPFCFFRLHVLVAENLPRKDAGAGLSRKIGMDEAIRRFFTVGNKQGIIISLDADTLVAHNYFTEIENFFNFYTKADACNIYFEHPVEGNEFSGVIYSGIAQYELFLRYYIQALRSINFPFSFHTIGSGFAVKSESYIKQGGMNKRTAGEDFYFLHKLIPQGRFYELNSTTVYPSPRVSGRVPFGTGAAMMEFIRNPERGILAYNPLAFDEISRLINLVELNYNSGLKDIISSIKDECMRDFLLLNNFNERIAEIIANSRGIQSFKKRFFTWFNAFRVFKFLNYSHENCYSKLPVAEASWELLNKTDIEMTFNPEILNLLNYYRDMQRIQQWEFRF